MAGGRAFHTRTAFVLISHDRAFLRALSRRRRSGSTGARCAVAKSGFDGFEDWRETVWAEEDEARHKLDRKIKPEAKWAVEGISARRKRNMGRVRALAGAAGRPRQPDPPARYRGLGAGQWSRPRARR